jgi:hypothetical protein
MPFSAPVPVASGVPYRVVSVADHEPTGIDDFLGDTALLLDLDGSPYTVYGAGAAAVEGVRFHEKDDRGHGKDVRVWSVRPAHDRRGYVADHLSACDPTQPDRQRAPGPGGPER